MDLGINDRVAVVTGCSAGIGRQIAKDLAAEGAQTVVVARRGPLLQTLRDEIESGGDKRPLCIAADLTDRDAIRLIYDETMSKFGRADIVVNNAGGSIPIKVGAADEEWDYSNAINFTAIRKLTEAFLPGMKERRWGRIFTIGGTSELEVMNATAIAKAATTLWAKSLSREVGSYGITVNCIAPGKVDSEQIRRNYADPAYKAEVVKRIPVGHFGEPADVSALVTFLSSPKAKYITGQRIDVDGGRRLAIW